MGLLSDIFGAPGSDANQSMGLLAAGLMRGDAASGLLAANQVYADAPRRRMQEQLLQAQIAETMAQADERKSVSAQKQAEAQRLAGIQQGLPGLFRQPGMTGGQAMPQEMGGVPMFSKPMGAAPMQSTPGGFDLQSALALRMSPKEIADAAALANIGRPEVARTVEVDDGKGGKATMQIDKFGQPVGQSLPGYIAPVQVGQGDRTTFVKPAAGVSLPMNMTFADKNAAANLALSRQRLAFDQGQVGKPQFHDGQWISPPTAANPTGTATPVPGFQKPLGEGAKKQVVGIDSLHAAIDEYKKELANFGVTDLAKPDKRAAMGTAYNNMMLQAKEAYNLGVLNGPDFQILSSTVTDPRTFQGAITSNAALAKQATSLDQFMQRTRKAVLNQGSGSGGASGGWSIQKVN